MESTNALVEQLEKDFGLALQFDDQGRCALEHEDDFEILIAKRDDDRALAFATVVSYVMAQDTGELFGDLLRQNMSGSVTGPFYFALDRTGGRVLLTGQERVEDLTAEKFMQLVNLLITARGQIAGVVDAAQSEGISIGEAMDESHAPEDDVPAGDGHDAPPPPGTFV